MPFPAPPVDWARPDSVPFDVPERPPAPPARQRRADTEAKAPTGALQADHAELASWKAYRGFIRAGVETFWSNHENGLGNSAGLAGRNSSRPFVVETYPR